MEGDGLNYPARRNHQGVLAAIDRAVVDICSRHGARFRIVSFLGNALGGVAIPFIFTADNWVSMAGAIAGSAVGLGLGALREYVGHRHETGRTEHARQVSTTKQLDFLCRVIVPAGLPQLLEARQTGEAKLKPVRSCVMVPREGRLICVGVFRDGWRSRPRT